MTTKHPAQRPLSLRTRTDPPARPDLNGHKAIDANVCFWCGGPLRSRDGSFRETLYESGRSAFAAAACERCV